MDVRRITTGELGTFIGDLRWAGPLGHDWYTKLVVNHTRSGSFTQSRTDTIEYPGLPLEVAPALGDAKATSADARFDKYFANGRQLVLEGGFSQNDGGTYLSQGGRFSVLDSKRSWSRVNFNATHWTAQAYVNTRYGDPQALFAPVHYPTASVQFKGEVQGNQHFADARGRAVFGASYLQEHVDSADSAGVQTLYLHAVTTKEPALFGQLDYDLSSQVKVVGALRWDESTLHAAQLSPKAALVYLPVPNHSLHVSFDRGFQVGNYNELFVYIPLAPPLDLSAIDAAFAPLTGRRASGFWRRSDLRRWKPEPGRREGQERRGRLRRQLRIARADQRRRLPEQHARLHQRHLSPGINPTFPAYRAPAALPAAIRTVIEQTVNAAHSRPDQPPERPSADRLLAMATSVWSPAAAWRSRAPSGRGRAGRSTRATRGSTSRWSRRSPGWSRSRTPPRIA